MRINNFKGHTLCLSEGKTVNICMSSGLYECEMYSISQKGHIWLTALMKNQECSVGMGDSLTCINLNHTIFEAHAAAEKCGVSHS